MKFIVIFLFFIPMAYGGQSFISASYLSSEDESTQSYLTLGTEVFKNGNISAYMVKNTYQADDDTMKTSGSGLNYSHYLNKYFIAGVGGRKLEEGEYLNSQAANGFVGINMNYLWDSFVKSYLEVYSQSVRYDYYREFTKGIVERELTQRSVTISWRQEITLWLQVMASYGSYKYSDDPVALLDANPILINFVPEYQSLLYGLPEHTKTLGATIIQDQYELSFQRTLSYNIVTKVEEVYSSLSFTYFLTHFDLSLVANRVQLEDTEYGQTQMGLTYYF